MNWRVKRKEKVKNREISRAFDRDNRFLLLQKNPSLSRNNNLYFTATRQDVIGTEDIFLSRFADGKYLDPEPLDTAVNTETYEFNAYISPDESILIFGSYGREDDLGGGDLYISRKDEHGNWMTAKNMGPGINSTNLDFCPFVDFNRGNFYFSSDRFNPVGEKGLKVKDVEAFAGSVRNGMGNIYRIAWKRIE